MGTRPFAKRSTGHSAPPAAPPGPLERQQAILLELLRSRDGAAVGFTELHDAGIEFPASVVTELELAGAPIERCPVIVEGTRSPGVRLDPARPPEDRFAAAGITAPAAEADRARDRGSLPGPRRLVPAGAMLLALAVLGVLGVAQLAAGGAHPTRPPARPRTREIALSGAAHRGAAGVADKRTATPPPPATPVSAALAVQLDARGHELLEGGSYGSAIQVLTRAVAATGEQLADCVQPVSKTCLTYAYALYDLGRALQLDGQPASAVPVLQDRLQIDNQRAVVAAELERATAQAG